MLHEITFTRIAKIIKIFLNKVKIKHTKRANIISRNNYRLLSISPVSVFIRTLKLQKKIIRVSNGIPSEIDETRTVNSVGASLIIETQLAINVLKDP